MSEHDSTQDTPWRGLEIVPRKRKMPLKRYKIRVILREDEDVCYVVVRARNKKNAKWFALQTYDITKAEIVGCLGRSRYEEFEERIETAVCIWLHSGYTHFIQEVPLDYLRFVREVLHAPDRDYISFLRTKEGKHPLILRVRDIKEIEEVR